MTGQEKLERILKAVLDAGDAEAAVVMLSNAEELEWPLPSDEFMDLFMRRVDTIRKVRAA